MMLAVDESQDRAPAPRADPTDATLVKAAREGER
jgi:hypothetical protein